MRERRCINGYIPHTRTANGNWSGAAAEASGRSGGSHDISPVDACKLAHPTLGAPAGSSTPCAASCEYISCDCPQINRVCRHKRKGPASSQALPRRRSYATFALLWRLALIVVGAALVLWLFRLSGRVAGIP